MRAGLRCGNIRDRAARKQQQIRSVCHRVSVTGFLRDPDHRILAHQRSRFTHYYFYIRDEVLGPTVMRVASFFPFQTTYYLNGHSFIEQELNRRKMASARTTMLSWRWTRGRADTAAAS